MKFTVRIRSIGLACIGWAHPMALGADVAFIRGVRVGKSPVYEPYIPGSSFKGALRSAASRIAEVYGFKTCNEVRPERIRGVHRELGGICDVCKLFGYPQSNTQSPLTISDFESTGKIETVAVTRVRLEDYSLKAAEGALFTTEHILPEAEFRGNIIITQDTEQRLLGLMLLSLAELRLGRLGRRSLMDLKIEEEVELEKALINTPWLNLLNELKEWLWSAIL